MSDLGSRQPQVDPHEDPDDRPSQQISWRAHYHLGHSINTAWLSESITSEHVKGIEDGWDLLVVNEQWRIWAKEMLDHSAFLYLAVRGDLARRRLLKTKYGVSMHLPAEEIFAAERAGQLAPFFAEIIHAIYEKWAHDRGCPPPPSVPAIS